MKNILTSILFLSILTVFSQSNGKGKTNNDSLGVIAENSKLTIQKQIDSVTAILEKFYSNEHKIKTYNQKIEKYSEESNKLSKRIKDNSKELAHFIKVADELSDSLNKIEKSISLKIKKTKKKDSLILKSDTLKLDSLRAEVVKNLAINKNEIEKRKENISKYSDRNKLYVDNISYIERKIKVIENNSAFRNYENYKKNNSNLFKDRKGEISFNYKQQNYVGFIADLDFHKIGMHLNFRNTKDKNAFKFIQLGKLKTYLESKNKDVLMLTNGGMYTPKNNPEGLLIADSVLIEPIDLENPKQMLNFYMMPNGVFYIDNGKAFIEESNLFQKKFDKNVIAPSEATQSGPMLLINNKHHPSFNHGSSSRKLRSGVGITNNGKVVFLISDRSITNFHDFATIFKDIFGCEDALFLDGVISKMYLKKKKPNSLGGNLGPIISITKK